VKIATFQKIADSLGISKQAVDKLYVKKGYLVKNEKGKIDIDERLNFQFLQSKGADFSVFGADHPVRKKAVREQTQPKTTKTVRTTPAPQKPPEEPSTLLKLDIRLKIETIKKKCKDSELQSLKIMELQKLLISRKIVDQLIGDFFGRFHEMLLTKPKGIVGDIKAEVKGGTNQTLIRMLQKSYMKELKKLTENAKKRYIDAIDTKIEEIEENGKS